MIVSRQITIKYFFKVNDPKFERVRNFKYLDTNEDAYNGRKNKYILT
jgi:hypothetical protein